MTTKDEIKNRISMALKDSVLQQGFEIICRENDELEKENAELKKRNGELAGQKASLERWFGEAKKIIQSFVWWHSGEDRGSIDSNNLVERAEQFLKENVK